MKREIGRDEFREKLAKLYYGMKLEPGDLSDRFDCSHTSVQRWLAGTSTPVPAVRRLVLRDLRYERRFKRPAREAGMPLKVNAQKQAIAESLNLASRALDFSELDLGLVRSAIDHVSDAVAKLAGLVEVTRGSCPAAEYTEWAAPEEEEVEDEA